MFIMNKTKEPQDNPVIENNLLKNDKLITENGKNCADTDKGCIRKRKSGWVILNNNVPWH